MDLGLRGKRVLITGSSQGIGLATACIFAREGARVILNGRSEVHLKEACTHLLDAVSDAQVEYVVADLGTAKGCDRMISAQPTVDILINNLGIFEPVEFFDITDHDWFRLFETNIMSGVRLSRHYLKGMLERDWGRIVFISSESAVQIPVEMIHYGTTKTAQLALARGLAEMTRNTSVTVNTVLAGPTRSEGVERFVMELAEKEGKSFEEMEQGFFEFARPSSLLQRFAKVEEIASVIVFAASQSASAVNGAPLRAEGGVIKACL